MAATLRSRGSGGAAAWRPDVSGDAIAVTLGWVAVATAFGVLAAVPLTRTGAARPARKRAAAALIVGQRPQPNGAEGLAG
jgi:hypothetical protein